MAGGRMAQSEPTLPEVGAGRGEVFTTVSISESTVGTEDVAGSCELKETCYRMFSIRIGRAIDYTPKDPPQHHLRA